MRAVPRVSAVVPVIASVVTRAGSRLRTSAGFRAGAAGAAATAVGAPADGAHSGTVSAASGAALERVAAVDRDHAPLRDQRVGRDDRPALGVERRAGARLEVRGLAGAEQRRQRGDGLLRGRDRGRSLAAPGREQLVAREVLLRREQGRDQRVAPLAHAPRIGGVGAALHRRARAGRPRQRRIAGWRRRWRCRRGSPLRRAAGRPTGIAGAGAGSAHPAANEHAASPRREPVRRCEPGRRERGCRERGAQGAPSVSRTDGARSRELVAPGRGGLVTRRDCTSTVHDGT